MYPQALKRHLKPSSQKALQEMHKEGSGGLGPGEESGGAVGSEMVCDLYRRL